MSRITLSLKKQVHEPEATSRLFAKSNNNESFELQFSRDRSFSDATIRTRSRSNSTSDYFTGGADTGVNFTLAKPPPLRRLSTINSAHSSHGNKSPVSMSSDIGDMLWRGGRERDAMEHHEMEVTHLKLPVRRDEETL